MTYKYLRAVRENEPDYFLVYEGVKVFGASPIAQCDKEEKAKKIVEALNRQEELKALLLEAVERFDFMAKQGDSVAPKEFRERLKREAQS